MGARHYTGVSAGHPKKGKKMAELTTVFFKISSGDIVKAIVPKSHIDFFQSLGAKRVVADFEENGLPDIDRGASDGQVVGNEIEDDEPMEKMNPDHGSGRPGSVKFHTLCLMELQTVDDVNDYLHTLTGQRLDQRIKKIDKARRRAIKVVKDWLNDKNE